MMFTISSMILKNPKRRGFIAEALVGLKSFLSYLGVALVGHFDIFAIAKNSKKITFCPSKMLLLDSESLTLGSTVSRTKATPSYNVKISKSAMYSRMREHVKKMEIDVGHALAG